MAKSKAVKVPSTAFAMQFEPGDPKAATAGSSVKNRSIPMVPVDAISVVGDFNVRVADQGYEEHIDYLTNSIMRQGFLPHKPLSGYVGKENGTDLFYLTGGFSRFAAVKRAIEKGAAITEVPMVLSPPGTSMLDLMGSLDTDNTGRPLSAFERAILAKRMINFGATEEEIATRMSVNPQYVKRLLYVMGLPKQLQEMIANGKANFDIVHDQAQKYGPKEAVQKLAAIKETEGKVTGRTVRKATEGFNPSRNLLRSAITYALDQITEGDSVEFLRGFIVGEEPRIKELRKHLRDEKKKAAGKAPVKTPANAAAKATGKGNAKTAAKGKANGSTPPTAAKRGRKASAPAAAPAAPAPGAEDDPL